MKKHRKEKQFLEQLRIYPNISVACEKIGVSRNTVYRWKVEDPEFRKSVDEALELGVQSINDLAESKVIGEIRSGNLRAAEYWLNNHKKDYVRPRPNYFWEKMFAQEDKITGFRIEIIEPKDKKKDDEISPLIQEI